MKKNLFLFLIYFSNIHANEQGCTISFFKTESSCSSIREKNKITIAPIVIKKKPIKTKEVEVKLRNILVDVKNYKKRNKEKTERLLRELNAMKKKFQKYKIKKSRELKKVKKKLYFSNKKLNSNNQKLVKIQKKFKKITKKVIKQKPKKKKNIIVKAIKPKIPKTTTPIVVHKVIHKMQPSPILMYDTPWIEIVVENNINIYDLALEYYGNKQAYKKIYLANQNSIGNDFQIYDGMTLIIPMTKDFEEKGIVLNQ